MGEGGNRNVHNPSAHHGPLAPLRDPCARGGQGRRPFPVGYSLLPAFSLPPAALACLGKATARRERQRGERSLAPLLPVPPTRVRTENHEQKAGNWASKAENRPISKVSCETVKPTFINNINHLQEKISQSHSFCVSVNLWIVARRSVREQTKTPPVARRRSRSLTKRISCSTWYQSSCRRTICARRTPTPGRMQLPAKWPAPDSAHSASRPARQPAVRTAW